MLELTPPSSTNTNDLEKVLEKSISSRTKLMMRLLALKRLSK
jgi:hypothetical protein